MEEFSYDSTAEETSLSLPSDHDLRVPYFCEENVWRLAFRKKHECPGDRFWVVWISNSMQKVPMFQQRASQSPDVSVCWDYHVILIGVRADDPQSGVWVYDIDSTLPYPCPLNEYIQHSFPYEWPYPFCPLFRLVEADLYLQYFSSDRMHMHNEMDGTWKATPPSYAPIQSGLASSTSTMQYYLNFAQKPTRMEIDPRAIGTILTKQQLCASTFV